MKVLDVFLSLCCYRCVQLFSFPDPLGSFALGGAALQNMSVCCEYVLGAERELQYVLPMHSQGASLFCIIFSLSVITDFELKSRHFELFVIVYV